MNIMKKALVIAMAFIMAFTIQPVYADEYGVELRMNVYSKEAKSGDTVQVGIEVTKNEGICALMFTVEYDVDALELVSIKKKDSMFPGAIIRNDEDATGSMGYVFASAGDSTTMSDDKNYHNIGEIIVMSFKVKDDVAVESVDIRCVETDAANFDAKSVKVKGCEAEVSIVKNAGNTDENADSHQNGNNDSVEDNSNDPDGNRTDNSGSLNSDSSDKKAENNDNTSSDNNASDGKSDDENKDENKDEANDSVNVDKNSKADEDVTSDRGNDNGGSEVLKYIVALVIGIAVGVSVNKLQKKTAKKS